MKLPDNYELLQEDDSEIMVVSTDRMITIIVDKIDMTKGIKTHILHPVTQDKIRVSEALLLTKTIAAHFGHDVSNWGKH